jgi:hypothetical protein
MALFSECFGIDMTRKTRGKYSSGNYSRSILCFSLINTETRANGAFETCTSQAAVIASVKTVSYTFFLMKCLVLGLGELIGGINSPRTHRVIFTRL